MQKSTPCIQIFYKVIFCIKGGVIWNLSVNTKRLERRSSELKRKKLQEEIWLNRIFNIIIRPLLVLIIEIVSRLTK